MNGDVRLRVEGLMLERLIQRALNEGACFRSVERPEPRAMIFETDSAGAAILAALCERFSLPCKVLSRRGRDAMWRRLKRRSTLLAGAAVCLTVLSLFLGRVWLIDIELTGERAASIQSIEDGLANLGIRPGMEKSKIDPSLLADALAASAPDFSFVGVRLQGVRLLVEAAPAVPAPQVYNLDGGRDLVAACDGIVLSVNVLAGEPCVQPGDTVVRGQVLIQGRERVSKEETRGIAALGSVVARTWHEGAASAPTTREIVSRTGRSSLSARLQLLNFEWPLLEGESYPLQETQTQLLPIGGLFLPLEICRTTAWETQTHTVELDESTLKTSLSTLAFAAAGAALSEAHPNGCETAGQWIEYTLDADGLLTARAVYETHTDIAVTRDALYKQGG